MENGKHYLGGIWLVACCLLLLTVHEAEALPSFARIYQSSCITCHESPPRLNAVGEAFRISGYKFPEDEVKRKLTPLALGDEAHERLWPESIWPGQKPNFSPISVLTAWAFEYHIDPGFDDTTVQQEELPYFSFLAPHEIELSWPVSLGEDIILYGDARFIQEDEGVLEMESTLAMKGWIQFEDLFEVENLLNLQLGTVGMHSIALLNARDEQGMPFQAYMVNTYAVPSLSTNDKDGTYDQAVNIREFVGNAWGIQPMIGIELNGFTRHIFYNVGVVNGKINDPTSGIFFMGAGTNSSSKDYYANLAIKFGGLGFDASTGEPEEDPFAENKKEAQSSSSSGFWRDDSLTLTFMGYTGEGLVEMTLWDNPSDLSRNGGQTTYYDDDDFWRLGAGFVQRYKDFTLSGGHIWGYNKNPYGRLYAGSVDSRAWFMESHYFFYPWLVPFVRLEGVKYIGLPAEETGMILDGEENRELVTLGCKIQIRPNVLLNLEGYFYTMDAGYDYDMDETIMAILRADF